MSSEKRDFEIAGFAGNQTAGPTAGQTAGQTAGSTAGPTAGSTTEPARAETAQTVQTDWTNKSDLNDGKIHIKDGKRMDHVMTEKEREKDEKAWAKQEKKMDEMGAPLHKDQHEGNLKPYAGDKF